MGQTKNNVSLSGPDSLPDCLSQDSLAISVHSHIPSLPFLSLVYLAPITWALCCSLKESRVSQDLCTCLSLSLELLPLACSWTLASVQHSLLKEAMDPFGLSCSLTMIVWPPPLPTYSLWHANLSLCFTPPPTHKWGQVLSPKRLQWGYDEILLAWPSSPH